jgi:hypothetical protein
MQQNPPDKRATISLSGLFGLMYSSEQAEVATLARLFTIRSEEE